MFNLLDFGERAGSGVPNILQTWEAQNWASPQVEEQYGPDRTKLTLSLNYLPSLNPSSELKHHAKSSSTLSIKEISQILDFCSIPRSRAEIQEFCGYNSAAYVRKKVLHPLLEGHQLVLTIPEKPNHPNQKYIRNTVKKG